MELDTVHVPRPLSSVTRAWTAVWPDRRFRVEAVLSLAVLVAVLNVMARFLTWVEHRPGVVLPDAVLAAIAPRDVTWVTFTLVYGGLLTAVAVLLPYPRRLVLGLQAYTLMVLLRLAVMAVTPLEAPPGMLPLKDPLVEVLGTGQVLTKDLFFSGHTSTLFLLTLLAPKRATRAFFLVCTAMVAACVLWQHVHYTVDVVVAPVFSFIAYTLATLLQGSGRARIR
jgi:hypothetical protein